MKKLGSNPTDADIKQMIASVDDNGDGEIDFEEFLVLMSRKKSDPDKEIRDAFNKIDEDGDGEITKKELKKLFDSLGQKLSDQELTDMMNTVDTDRSGAIDFEEFKEMMLC